MQNEIISYTQHHNGHRGDSAQAGGRSMIEMLGVLAIIGVLSVGALSGYRMAMRQYRVNEMIDYMMRVGEAAAHHGTTQKTGQVPDSSDGNCPMYVNGEAAPFALTCRASTSPTDAFGPYVFVSLTGSILTSDVQTAIIKRVGGWTTRSVSMDNTGTNFITLKFKK